jgi:hypothetical protein
VDDQKINNIVPQSQWERQMNKTSIKWKKRQMDQYLMTKNMNKLMNKLDIWHHSQISILISVGKEYLDN